MLPIVELVALCHKSGIKEVFVDGAHAVGQIDPLSMRDIGAEYYVSNLHKWAFAPPSVAFFYAKPGMSKSDRVFWSNLNF